jgi:hypothetical protein
VSSTPLWSKRHAAVLGIKRYVQAHTIDPELTRGIAAA